MKRIANFFRSILVFLLVIVLQVVVTVVAGVISSFHSGGSFANAAEAVIDTLNGTSATSPNLWVVNIVYGLIALILFGLWYRRALILPFRGKKTSDRPSGFSFHTIVAILFLAIGLYYVTTFIVDALSAIRPEWMLDYTSMIEDTGYTNPGILLILYSVILAPIVEEIIFRGLIFRFARYALPFWIANIWQALLFALLHGDLMQGIYAFVMGLFLGFVCHRGRGIKYSILVHIIYNIIGVFFSTLVWISLELNYAIAICCGIALTIFAVWLFYTDFIPDEKSLQQAKKSRKKEKRQ